jgi:ABC-type amino acid transport substrate-binding protein
VQTFFRRYELGNDEVDSGAEVLLPLAYPFPNIGTYVILMFIPFSAWYLGRILEPVDHLVFYAASLPSSFVAPVIGIPFLLDLTHLPSDMMELFIVSTVYTDRIRVVLGAMHLFCLALLTLAIKRGVFRVDLKRLAQVGVLSVILMVGALLGTRTYLDYALGGSCSKDAQLVRMHSMEPLVKAVHLGDQLPDPDLSIATEGHLASIQSRRMLRVGYLKDSLPFAFTNVEGQLVGFDIEIAHHLADDLGVGLQLILLDTSVIDQALEQGQVDIVMSGIAITPGRLTHWEFPTSPLDLSVAFLVPDHRRSEFESQEAVASIERLRLGIIQADAAFRHLVETRFPNAILEQIA